MELRPKQVLSYMITANELATLCNGVFTHTNPNSAQQTAMIFPEVHEIEPAAEDESIASYRRISLRVVKLGFGVSSLTVFDRVAITRSTKQIPEGGHPGRK